MDLNFMRERSQFWFQLAEEFSKEPLSFEDLICKKYIELGSVTAVAQFLNENAYRKETGTVYKSTDVSNIIKKPSCEGVNPIILNFAKKQYKRAKKYMANCYS
jgi:hypothetical protein